MNKIEMELYKLNLIIIIKHVQVIKITHLTEYQRVSTVGKMRK